MRRSARIHRGCCWALLAFAVVVAVAPIQCIIWDGGFPDVEYRMTFVDGNGHPVQGVTLQVLTPAGGASYFYPVDEFLPDQAPTSDAGGRMTFHHTTVGLEFAGRDYCNVLGIKLWGTGGAPHYACVFRHGESEVARLQFNSLRPKGDEYDNLPSVTYRHPFPSEDLIRFAPRRERDSERWEPAHFDMNRDGIIDGWERLATRIFARRLNRELLDTDRSYPIVERVVTVANP